MTHDPNRRPTTNVCTRFAEAQPRGPWLDARVHEAAWRDALRHAQDRRLKHIGSTAFLVYLRVGAGRDATTDVRVMFIDAAHSDAPLALALGRHTHCDFRSIPGASLRHLALLLWAAHDDEPAVIEVRDLATGIGVSGSAPDALRVRLGAAELVVLRADPGAWFDEPTLDDVSLLAPSPQRARPTQLEITTSVRSLRRALPTGSSLRARQPHVNPDRLLRVVTNPVELVRGLLLGRYDRCDVQTEVDSVSRVHALLLLRRGHVWVVDVGSTLGTTVYDGATGRVTQTLDALQRVARLDSREGVNLGQVVVSVDIDHSFDRVAC